MVTSRSQSSAEGCSNFSFQFFFWLKWVQIGKEFANPFGKRVQSKQRTQVMFFMKRGRLYSQPTCSLGDLDWKLAWKGIGSLRPKTLEISSWEKGPERTKKIFSIFDSSLCNKDSTMVYMKRTLEQVTLKVDPLVSIVFFIGFVNRRATKCSPDPTSWLFSTWVVVNSGRKWPISESCRGICQWFHAIFSTPAKVTSGKNCICIVDGRNTEILWRFCGWRDSSGMHNDFQYTLPHDTR